MALSRLDTTNAVVAGLAGHFLPPRALPALAKLGVNDHEGGVCACAHLACTLLACPCDHARSYMPAPFATRGHAPCLCLCQARRQRVSSVCL